MTTPTPPSAASQSVPQPAPQPSATPYPGYPYGGYPYYGYPYYPYPYPAGQPGKLPALPRSPSEGPGKPWAARARNLALAVVAVVLTLAAIFAAASSAASAQTAPTPASEGLRQVYSQALANDSTNWTLDQGCGLQDGGLLADGTSDAVSTDLAVCKFVPSTQQDLLSQGFQATLVMAPSGDVATLEQGGIALGEGDGAYLLEFSQQGQFAFGVDSGPGPSVAGSTIAWHTDPSIANTITLDYSAANTLLHVYVNGQQVLTQNVPLEDSEFPNVLSLFGSSGDQALFTSFTLYSAAP